MTGTALRPKATPTNILFFAEIAANDELHLVSRPWALIGDSKEPYVAREAVASILGNKSVRVQSRLRLSDFSGMERLQISINRVEK